MRTTVTLDDDLASQLQELAHRQRKPFKVVLNEAIRRGVGRSAKHTSLPPFNVSAKRMGLRAGIDELRLNQMSDELAIEAAADKLKSGR